MIIFTPIRNMPVDVLEFKGIRQVVTYNLSSYYSDIPTLNMLIPSISYMTEDAFEGDGPNLPIFDIQYGNYIIENDSAFIQLMNIILPVYNSPDVLVQILINNSEFRDIITESLAKLIQQRYGYNTHIVNEVDDFIYVEESDFSIPGLFAIDKDLTRYLSLNPPSMGDIYE